MSLLIANFTHILAGALAGTFASGLEKPLAYLDPGSGSFILQIILASLLASLLFFKNFWRRLIGAFRKPGPEDNDPAQDDEGEPKE